MSNTSQWPPRAFTERASRITRTDIEVAERLRLLVDDTWTKLNADEELDQGYVQEDLLHRLLSLASDLDGRTPEHPLRDHRTAYEIEES